jgi:hypothetical protein
MVDVLMQAQPMAWRLAFDGPDFDHAKGRPVRPRSIGGNEETVGERMPWHPRTIARTPPRTERAPPDRRPRWCRTETNSDGFRR